MKGYVFTYGVDGFGADIAPAHEVGVYLDFDKAFAKLIELNHDAIKNFYIDSYYENDLELTKAKEEEEKKINEQFINTEPDYGMYALEEIEIIE